MLLIFIKSNVLVNTINLLLYILSLFQSSNTKCFDVYLTRITQIYCSDCYLISKSLT